ncbi:hypothetical protein AAY473_000089 [Plecturocebus cupreus]
MTSECCSDDLPESLQLWVLPIIRPATTSAVVLEERELQDKASRKLQSLGFKVTSHSTNSCTVNCLLRAESPPETLSFFPASPSVTLGSTSAIALSSLAYLILFPGSDSISAAGTAQS